MSYTFLEHNDPNLISCIDQLNLADSFPSSKRSCLQSARRYGMIFLSCKRPCESCRSKQRLHSHAPDDEFITKQEAGRGLEAQFRVLGEGLPVVLPYIDPSVILDAKFAPLKTLLMAYYPPCTSFLDPFRSVIENRSMALAIIIE
ncbi:uncharacterized protein BJ212DRAFT_264018 [Suillus subaureus]|uniref:Uncharacterized protein n=1 Tax=Suillus subaureus TaxID=48587 RepID=A0A9P7E9U0_9AGAM|nr:uncharacterized protein BJ212DRAFT_264018 [Suillus subaureus]KAG1815222.1 hypothetical protein BJ212DRAFT_264018 [Suillus subaureus]